MLEELKEKVFLNGSFFFFFIVISFSKILKLFLIRFTRNQNEDKWIDVLEEAALIKNQREKQMEIWFYYLI
jgi:hypothetical protein